MLTKRAPIYLSCDGHRPLRPLVLVQAQMVEDPREHQNPGRKICFLSLQDNINTNMCVFFYKKEKKRTLIISALSVTHIQRQLFFSFDTTLIQTSYGQRSAGSSFISPNILFHSGKMLFLIFLLYKRKKIYIFLKTSFGQPFPLN